MNVFGQSCWGQAPFLGFLFPKRDLFVNANINNNKNIIPVWDMPISSLKKWHEITAL